MTITTAVTNPVTPNHFADWIDQQQVNVLTTLTIKLHQIDREELAFLPSENPRIRTQKLRDLGLGNLIKHRRLAIKLGQSVRNEGMKAYSPVVLSMTAPSPPAKTNAYSPVMLSSNGP